MKQLDHNITTFVLISYTGSVFSPKILKFGEL